MIIPEPTPNPNAMKFTVGKAVGGPTTFVASKPTDDPLGQALLAIDGVTSVFMTADFVTISKDSSTAWTDIVDTVVSILEDHFSAS